jgi:hypothetical protein
MERASSKVASDVLLKSMTNDIVSVLTEQHNSLILALAAQTQKLEAQTQQLDTLERVTNQVCLRRKPSDEPMFGDVVQTVGDLRKRLDKLRSAHQSLAQQGFSREKGAKGVSKVTSVFIMCS